MVRQLKRLFEWLTEKKLRVIDVILVILLLFSYIVCSTLGFGVTLWLNLNVNIEAGYMAVMDTKGNSYIVDRSQERLLKIHDNKVEWEITDVIKQRVNQIENVFVDDDGNIYVHGLDWDSGGFLLDNERILKYGSDGQYIGNVYTLKYDADEKEDKPRLFDLRVVDGAVECIKLGDDGFETIRIANRQETVLKSQYKFADALTFIQNIVVSPNSDKIYIVDKRGKILCADKGGISTYYDFKDNTVPYDIVVGSDESVYFTDLYSQAVIRILPNKEMREVFSKNSVFKDEKMDKNDRLILTTSVDSVTFPDGETQDVVCSVFGSGVLYAQKQDGEVICNQQQFEPGSSYIFKEIFRFICPLISLFCVVALLVRILLILVFNKFNFKLLFFVETIIILTTIIVSFVILPIILPAITDVCTDGMENQLLSITDMVSKDIDVDKIGRINKTSDFMNDDYKAVLRKLELATFRYSNDDDLKMGGRIEKSIDGVEVAIAYPNVRIGPYYPLDYSEAQEIQKIYETKKSSVYKVESTTGHYLLARSPILNSNGEMVACICVAKELSVIEKTIVAVIEQIVVNLSSFIVLVIFLINEVVEFIAHRKEYRQNKTQAIGGKRVVPDHVLRLSNVIFSMSINISSAFLPIYILSFDSAGLGIPRMLAASIPISINVAFILLASAVSLNVFERFGFRKVLIFAICCLLFSDIILATTWSYHMVAIALLMNGLGYGLLIESKRSYLAGLTYKDRNRVEIFCESGAGSGKFFGIFIGGFLAVVLSYSKAFYMAIITDVLAFVFCIYFCKTYVESKRNNVVQKSQMGIFKFFWSKEILPYVVIVPVIWGIILGFAGYYVPIYGSLNNFYENEISLALAIVSFNLVFFSSNITRFIIKKFNGNGIYLAILIGLFAILLLITFNQSGLNMGVFCISLLMLGIAYSFGSNVCRYKFLTMNRVMEYGENRAQSVYNLFFGIGMVASSLLYGFMMSKNIVISIWLFVIICVILMTAYKVLFDRKANN